MKNTVLNWEALIKYAWFNTVRDTLIFLRLLMHIYNHKCAKWRIDEI